MKHHRLALAVLGILVFTVFGCSDTEFPSDPRAPEGRTPVTQIEGDPCGEPLVVTLLAGQYIDVGTVEVVNDEGSLCVTVTTTGGWVMGQTHVAIATSLEDLPQNGAGNPQIGHFELSSDHNPPVDTVEHCIDLDVYGYEVGDLLFIAVHAEVEFPGDEENPPQEETAWADGLDFPGHSWATYFNYEVQPCEEENPCEITVVYPNGDWWLCLTFGAELTWNSAGTCGEWVSIELLRDGEVCLLIAESAVNSGYYFWPEVLQCDYMSEGYTIRVTDLESGAWDDSDGAFEIIYCEE